MTLETWHERSFLVATAPELGVPCAIVCESRVTVIEDLWQHFQTQSSMILLQTNVADRVELIVSCR